MISSWVTPDPEPMFNVGNFGHTSFGCFIILAVKLKNYEVERLTCVAVWIQCLVFIRIDPMSCIHPCCCFLMTSMIYLCVQLKLKQQSGLSGCWPTCLVRVFLHLLRMLNKTVKMYLLCNLTFALTVSNIFGVTADNDAIEIVVITVIITKVP